jgi:glycogen debranching enzyme
LPSFDVTAIPFSRRGSWLNLSPVVALHTVRDNIHLVSHQTGMHPVLEFVPGGSSRESPGQVIATPGQLTWEMEDEGRIDAVFERVDAIRLRGDVEMTIRDATRELTPFSGTYFFQDPLDGAATFTSYETGRRYRISVLSGRRELNGAEALGAHGNEAPGAYERSLTLHPVDGTWEILLEEIETAAPPASTALSDFDNVRRAVEDEFTQFLEAIAPWRSSRTPAAPLAAYVLWSATVSPRGFLGRESILMSKHWMDKVWSWDHCFNALGVGVGEPQLAIDQLLAPFDHQERSGALPDSVTHSEVLYNYVKPPIHGWAVRRLRKSGVVFSSSQLRDLYQALSRWTRFWLESRRAPGRRLPYYQHGNDSGWDNSTAFDHDRVVEAPDLAAFLLVQLDVLRELADELGEDGTRWATEQTAIRDALLEELWDDDGFRAVGALSRRSSKRSSLLIALPILAAEQLPDVVRERLAAKIENHLTEWGLATQLTESEEYQADGYWRGPIWAPATALIEDGLRRAGACALADEVSSRFRRLCELSGFAENFDALSGRGLRDRAYTWTASVYLTLARDAESRAEAAVPS